MQLRSLEDHSPLPNIIVGDIGTKMGNGAYNSMDNGFLMFDQVRIPRDQMLMRSPLSLSLPLLSVDSRCTYSSRGNGLCFNVGLWFCIFLLFRNVSG